MMFSIGVLIAVADAVAAMFMAIILICHYLDGKDIAEQTKAFRSCVWACLVGLISDAVAFALEDTGGPFLVVWISNYLSYIALDVFGAFFTLYIHERIIESKPEHSKHLVHLAYVLLCADIVLSSIGAITGDLFAIRNGTFVLGSWSDYIGIIPMLCLVVNYAMIVSNAGALGRKQVAVLCSYLAMPALASLMQAINGTWDFGYVGCAVGTAIIYAFLQSGVIAAANIRAEVYEHLSVQDSMTGLRNRRGYEEDLADIQEHDGNRLVGTAFCDLNSLKEVNDTLGHEAGDDLIRRIAELLQRTCPSGDLYRIGGDEFVIVVRNADERSFADAMSLLADTLRENDHIASLGYEIDTGSDIMRTIKVAEQLMYADKERYYRESGKKRRGQD